MSAERSCQSGNLSPSPSELFASPVLASSASSSSKFFPQSGQMTPIRPYSGHCPAKFSGNSSSRRLPSRPERLSLSSLFDNPEKTHRARKRLSDDMYADEEDTENEISIKQGASSSRLLRFLSIEIDF